MTDMKRGRHDSSGGLFSVFGVRYKPEHRLDRIPTW